MYIVGVIYLAQNYFFRPIMKIDSCVAFYIISLVVNICIECFIIALMNTDASLLGVTQEAH